MSNQIAEHTIESCYVIEVQMGTLFYSEVRKFCVKERTLCISALFFKNWATTNLLPNKLWQFASSCDWRMFLACFSQGWGQKWGSLPLLSLGTNASMVRKCCWLLEGKATQPIKQQAENRSDNCILGNNYLFTGHSFMTRNSNQTTRRFPLKGVYDWAETRYR